MRKTLLAILLIAISVPALAVGKVTSDPNAPGAAAPKDEQVEVTDARLTQKVTYSEPRKTVSAILDELTKSTGVVFKAGYNNKDWQVRDRKMTVYAKDVPLSELMSSIARVMKFKWERGGKDGAWTYRLFMDRRTLLDAEAQRVREEQRVEAEQAKKRAKGLADYAKMSVMTPEEKAKLKTDNPFLYAISGAAGNMGGSMGAFFRETPMAFEAISQGQRLDVPGSALSPAAQAGLVQAMKGMMEIESKFGGGKGHTLPDGYGSDLSKMSITVNKTLEMTKGMPGAGMMLGDLSVSYDGRDTMVPFIDPASGFAKIIGKAMIESDEQGRPMDEVMKEHQAEFMSTMMSEIKAGVGGEPLNEHPEDPALKVKVTLKPESQKLQDVEKSLAEVSKLAVVSDNFGISFSAGQPPATEMELKDLLDKIGDSYVYNWDKHSGVIELRDRNWFKKRAAQIPEEWLENWRQELTKTGTIEIDSLAEIAALTQEQLMANVISDETLSRSSLAGTVFGGREALRFYGSLTPDQRAAIFSKSGMDFATLTPDQTAQASKLILTKHGADLVNSGKPISLLGERKASDKPAAEQKAADKSVFYVFSLVVDGNNLGADWTFSTPQAYPPVPKPVNPQAATAAKPADATKPATAPQPAK